MLLFFVFKIMSLTKFSNLIFPIYCLKNKPYDIKFAEKVVKIKLTKDSKNYLIADIYKDKSYFNKLIELDSKKRIIFDYTVLNMESLVFSIEHIKWGITEKGQFVDFSSKVKVPCVSRKIIKKKGNFIFLSGVTYPFLIPNQLNISEMDFSYNYIETVLINETWYIFKVVDFLRHHALEIWI